MGGILLTVLLVGYLIYAFIKDNQFGVRGKLQNREQAQAGASIVSAEPKVVGSKRNKHYVLVVTFSDGTVFQDKCSTMETGWMQYTIRLDKKCAEEVLAKALEAHEQAVRERGQA